MSIYVIEDDYSDLDARKWSLQHETCTKSYFIQQDVRMKATWSGSPPWEWRTIARFSTRAERDAALEKLCKAHPQKRFQPTDDFDIHRLSGG